jgi:SAM-dependent methyltransferase
MEKLLSNLLQNTHDQALKRRAKLIIKNLDLKGDEKVLDAGCGDGFYLKLLISLYPNLDLYGIDIDGKALKIAESNLEDFLNDKKIKIFERSIDNTEFKDSFFDAVFATEVLEHVPNDLEAVSEVKRILKKDGKFVFTVPNFNFPFMWDPLNYILQKFFNFHIKSGFFAGIWNQHLRLYKIDELVEIASKNDMKIDNIKSVTHYSLPFNHYILNFGARLLHDTNIIKKDSSYNKFQMVKKNKSKISLLTLYTFFVDLIDKKNNKIDASYPSVSLLFVLRK